MAEIKWTIDCKFCGEKNGVHARIKTTKFSRTMKVVKCKKCNKQQGLTESLNRQ